MNNTLGGSSNFTITKANLPNVKIPIDNFIATIGNHRHLLLHPTRTSNVAFTSSNYISSNGNGNSRDGGTWYWLSGTTTEPNVASSGNAGAGNTSSVSTSTNALGSGSSINYLPNYIQIKLWKRLS